MTWKTWNEHLQCILKIKYDRDGLLWERSKTSHSSTQFITTFQLSAHSITGKKSCTFKLWCCFSSGMLGTAAFYWGILSTFIKAMVFFFHSWCKGHFTDYKGFFSPWRSLICQRLTSQHQPRQNVTRHSSSLKQCAISNSIYFFIPTAPWSKSQTVYLFVQCQEGNVAHLEKEIFFSRRTVRGSGLLPSGWLANPDDKSYSHWDTLLPNVARSLQNCVTMRTRLQGLNKYYMHKYSPYSHILFCKSLE